MCLQTYTFTVLQEDEQAYTHRLHYHWANKTQLTSRHDFLAFCFTKQLAYLPE